MPSAATVPRVTTPYRSRSVRARACARTVGSPSRGGSNDQRPATVGGPEREAVRAAAVREPYRPRGTVRRARCAV
ncbi:hypothetical protein GA0115246_111817, partial [Streptomyces sp. SolWspMP-sol7th]